MDGRLIYDVDALRNAGGVSTRQDPAAPHNAYTSTAVYGKSPDASAPLRRWSVAFRLDVHGGRAEGRDAPGPAHHGPVRQGRDRLRVRFEANAYLRTVSGRPQTDQVTASA